MWYGVVCGLAAGAFWGMIFVMPRWLAAFSPMELVNVLIGVVVDRAAG